LGRIDEITTLSTNLEALNLLKLLKDVQINSKTRFALLFEQIHLDNVTAFMSVYSVVSMCIYVLL